MCTNTMKRTLTALGLAVALPFTLAACGEEAAKPSKDEVSAAMDDLLAASGMSPETLEATGLSEEQFNGYRNCIVNSIYDDVSAESLQYLVDGDYESPVSKDDSDKIDSAIQTCASELGV